MDAKKWPMNARRRVARTIMIAFVWGSAFGPLTSGAAILVCRNGDRLEGEIASETEETIVFNTANFGSVHVKRATVAAIEGVMKEVEATGLARATEPAKPSGAPTAGPSNWKGRIALTIDRTRSAGHQDSVALDFRLQREWTRDEIRIESAYDFREDDQRRNADTLKASTQWVRRVSDRYFGMYRAASEWNRSLVYNGRDTSYVLLQQEIGTGVSFAVADGRRVRFGISENLYNLWARPQDFSMTGNNEAIFAEVEWPLPGDARLVHRGVVFYSTKHGSAGVENSLELSRRISKTVSLSVKHELREDVPDVRLQDYNNLRLLLGYEF